MGLHGDNGRDNGNYYLGLLHAFKDKEGKTHPNLA